MLKLLSAHGCDSSRSPIFALPVVCERLSVACVPTIGVQATTQEQLAIIVWATDVLVQRCGRNPQWGVQGRAEIDVALRFRELAYVPIR